MNSVARYSLLLTSLLVLATPVLGATGPALPSGDVSQEPVQLAQEAITETVLFFETDSRAVRIFRRGSDLFMNLYNKTTDRVEVRNTPAELVPSTEDRTVYKNSLGEAERFARITVLNETELEIRGANGASGAEGARL
ncbi:MAG: hypothetical protein HC922_02365 [Leptolyngbyaceae cyanobacterium SM2_3_12]|nr:hypothetical protein [Leptolyngbyaceae cyanobacterium SM2_3_12]